MNEKVSERLLELCCSVENTASDLINMALRLDIDDPEDKTLAELIKTVREGKQQYNKRY